ncbi:hypothetical protein ACLKA7_001569 [Drosophila subpalustris]
MAYQMLPAIATSPYAACCEQTLDTVVSFASVADWWPITAGCIQCATVSLRRQYTKRLIINLTIGAIHFYRQLLSVLVPLAANAALQLNFSYGAGEFYESGENINVSDLYIYNDKELDLISSPSSMIPTATKATTIGSYKGTVATAIGSAETAQTPMTLSKRSVSRVIADVPIWVIPCYSIILLCAVIGNLLVVLTLVQNRRMRTITNVFLLNLAISDILLGVLCMPVTLIGTLLRNFIFGEFLCKLIQFAQVGSEIEDKLQTAQVI